MLHFKLLLLWANKFLTIKLQQSNSHVSNNHSLEKCFKLVMVRFGNISRNFYRQYKQRHRDLISFYSMVLRYRITQKLSIAPIANLVTKPRSIKIKVKTRSLEMLNHLLI